MSAEYPRLLLGDLIIHQKGFAFKSVDYQKNGIPVVRVSNFTVDSIDTSDLKYVSEKIGRDNYKVALNTNDVVIATVGSWPKNPASIVGKTICVPSEMNGALMNQNSVIVRVKNNCPIDQKYLFIALKTKPFSEYLVSTAQGSANQASVTLGDIFSYEVEWPEPEIRKLIVSVVDSMNQKIILNRQINQTLESMAQAIFQSWFVDFDPVKAKIAAREQWQILTDDQRTEWLNELLNKQDYLKTCLLELTAKVGLNDDENLQLDSSLDFISCRGHGPASSESLDIGLNNLRKEWQSKIAGPALQSASEILYLNIAAMTAISSRDETSLAGMSADEIAQLYKTASLFPERLVESELGEIPEGWEVRRLDDLVEIGSAKRIFSKEYVEAGVPFYRGKEVTELSIGNNIQPEIFICRERYEELKKKSGAPKEHDILITSVGTIGNTYLVRAGDEFYFKDGNLTWIKSYKKDVMPYFLKIWFDSSVGASSIENIKIGSTQQAITISSINSLKLISPTSEIHNYFNNVIEDVFSKIIEQLKETKLLSDLRDSLLPKLLSGELDVTSLTELADIDPAAMDV